MHELLELHDYRIHHAILQLKWYVEHYYKKGFSSNEIRKILVSKGWDKHLVKRAVYDLIEKPHLVRALHELKWYVEHYKENVLL